MSRNFVDIGSAARRSQEVFAHLLSEDVSDERWEACAIRTTQDDRRPQLIYFGTDGAWEMDIRTNEDKGDRNATDALRRAIGMLGQAGWQLVSDAYFESRWLDHGRRELYFKRRRNVSSTG